MKFLPLCQVLGTMASDRSSYFPDNVLEPIFTAEPVAVPKFPEIYVGIDPASHNSSSMGLSAIGVKDGTVFLMGRVTQERSELITSLVSEVFGVEKIVKVFTYL